LPILLRIWANLAHWSRIYPKFRQQIIWISWTSNSKKYLNLGKFII
jgi:hypothetical protein